jgi:hypothetical protein
VIGQRANGRHNYDTRKRSPTMVDDTFVSACEVERLAEELYLPALLQAAGHYSLHEKHKGHYELLDNRRLLESLMAWPDLRDDYYEGTIDLLEEVLDVRNSRGTGPAMTLADHRVLYALMLHAGTLAEDDEKDVQRLSRIMRDAVVLEGSHDDVLGFLCQRLGLA